MLSLLFTHKMQNKIQKAVEKQGISDFLGYCICVCIFCLIFLSLSFSASLSLFHSLTLSVHPLVRSHLTVSALSALQWLVCSSRRRQSET